MRLQAPIPQLTDAILRRQLVYQTAEAEASRHHHGCLCSRDHRPHVIVFSYLQTKNISYKLALAISHDDPHADKAIAEHERFALRAYAGHLPAWFFLAWSSCNLTLLRRKPKPGRTAAETPPLPIVVGEPT